MMTWLERKPIFRARILFVEYFDDTTRLLIMGVGASGELTTAALFSTVKNKSISA
jgi:hypothetical protein